MQQASRADRVRRERVSEAPDFLARLDAAKIHYTLGHFRDDTLAVEIAVPGERWEVEFFADGAVEVEAFTTNARGGLEGEAALDRLFATHGSE